MGMGLHNAAVVTVGDLLAKAERALAAAGVPEPRREAAELYAAVICGATSAAWLERGSEPPAAVRARFAEGVARSVCATDVSAAALAVAIETATLLGATERISFRRGHLLEPLLGDVVDAVVSN